jgi:hypothetical protein
VDLFWIPLGAGAHAARFSGSIYEAASAAMQRRERCRLFHSALEVDAPEGHYVVEQTPVPDLHGEARGVVATGPVGLRRAGSLRIFRYEVRRWLGGSIPDVHEAVASPLRLSNTLATARRVLDVVPSVPTPVWGRDEMRTGEMWNSNSIIAWILSRGGIDAASIHPPPGGRAPGWHAGLFAAARDQR